MPTSSSRLTVPQVRYLGKIFAVFRWAAGFAVIALVGLLQPPKNPALLTLLLLWVAAYNGPASVALMRLSNEAVPWVMRAVTLIDTHRGECRVLHTRHFWKPGAAHLYSAGIPG
ncbi:MAG: hypothetical protein M3Z28_04990 [Candidatus Dormibacteraeota bacterium]|nr:hypothetical protein [Candidatus Dormibacteraeota bacterium]